ncbi:MAG: glycoside hydrolase family 127 protein [Muribaculum sp.]|nr:glycoside hydrolase family 127 protein [Muribaculum sp.]
MLQPIALEYIESKGDLAARLMRNFDRMETPLYQPTQLFWTEDESGGWPADKEGRTILALVLDSRASKREPIYLDSIIRILPEKLNERGYMGSVHDFADEQQLSGHGWLLRGLCEYYEWTADTTAMTISKNIVNNLFLPIQSKVSSYPIEPQKRIRNIGDMSGSVLDIVDGWRLSSDVGCVFIGMEGLIHYYKHSRSLKVKELIDSLIATFLKLDLLDVKAQTHASLTGLRGMLRYMTITGDYSLLPEVEKRWQLYKQYGMTENYENFNWFGRYDTWTEPCAVVDSYIVAVQLWQTTRRPEYLTDAERIYFNGISVEQRANGGFGCNKPVGPIFSDVSVHADEAHWCCTMRGGEGLARVAESSYFIAGDTIFVPFYRPNRLSMPDGLTLEQKTNYPFSNEVTFTIESMSDLSKKLAIASPENLDSIKIYYNNKLITPSLEKGFFIINENLTEGDDIRITYKLLTHTLQATTDSKAFKLIRGPLILAASKSSTKPTFADSISFSPLYHLMSPSVSIDSCYSRQVLVNDPARLFHLKYK